MSLAQQHGMEPLDEVLEFPCSPAQTRFWVLDRMGPPDGALNIAVRWQLDGALPAEVIEQALQRVVARHEILRTGFAATADEPVQLVSAEVPFTLGQDDLRGLDSAAQAIAAERLAREEGRRRFDLAAPPLMRARLLLLGADRSMLLVTLHHLVADGWSVGVVAREMGEICDALTGGREAVLAPLPIHYGDYCRWYRERLQRDEFVPEIQYWTRQLAGLNHLELTSDRPDPVDGAASSDIVSLLLDRSESDALAALGRAQGNTLFVTVLAGLMVLLHRYTGETDIAVGTQVIGREEVELEALIGVFINTVVLRADLSADPTPASLLRQLQDTVQQALAHQNVPLEQLIQLLQPVRRGTANPFFSVNFIFQRSFIGDHAYGHFTLTDLPSFSPGRLYDLNFFMVERPEGWRISCEYDHTLFSAAFVTEQIRCWRMILRGMTADLEAPVSTLPMLDPATDAWLRKAERGPRPRHSNDTSLSRHIEAQAARTPRAVAVVQGRRTLTYAVLDKAANGLARYLRRQGVLPGMLVGILLPRDAELVVTLLAVLKAGGIAVLLDPSEPVLTLERRIAEIRLPWLLSHSTLRASHPGRIERNFMLDEAEVAIRREATSPLDIELAGTDPAFVVFVSRQAGQMRAVRLEHGALGTLLLGLTDRPGLRPDESLVSLGADDDGADVIQLLLPLMAGARLVLADRAEAAGGRALLELLGRTGPAMLPASPATLQRLLQAGWTGSPRLTLLASRVMTTRLKDRLLATGSPLWMLYGVPEATLWAAATPLASGDRPVRLKPMPGAGLLVLDRRGHRLPPGAVGELQIGGGGVVAGYLGQHAALRAGFATGPATDADGGARDREPLFRTGDRASWRPDGSIALLGSFARQVRLNGHPIDLAVIEDGLLDHPDVAEAQVVLSTDGITHKSSLTAYVVPRQDGLQDARLVEALRQLQSGWPRYRRCSVILVLPSLPAPYAAGVVEEPVEARPDSGAALETMQQRLLAIWNELLGRTDIGVDDDFFDLGGHSLIATRLVVRIQKEFGRTTDFATLFRASNVAELSRALLQTDSLEHDDQVRTVIPREPAQESGQGTIFAIGHTWIYDDLARQLGDRRGFVALPVTQPMDMDGDGSGDFALQDLRGLAAEQIAAIRAIQPHGPYVLIGLCSAGVLTYEVAQQLQEQGEPVPLLTLVDTWAPGYLQRMSSMRAWLADLSYRWSSLVADYRSASDGRPVEAARFVSVRLREFVGKRFRRLTLRTARIAIATTASGRGHWAEEDLPSYDDRVDPHDTGTAPARRPPFAGRLLVFHRDAMPQGRFLDARLGWGDLVAGPIEVFSLPGDHFSMFRGRGAASMAGHITERLQADVP